jgi:hypothetical protein
MKRRHNMKINKMSPCLRCAIILVFLYGCADAERTVVGNSFQSSYPKLDIPIDLNFTYLGKINYTGYHKDYYEGMRDLRSEYEFHIFVPKGKEHRIDKLMYIQIQKTETSFIDTIPQDKRNLDFDVADLNGENYKYYIMLTTFSNANPAVKHVMDSGYVLPSCVILNSFYDFAAKNIVVSINYVEDASPSGMSCKKKYSRDELPDRQKNYLADFHKRALIAIGSGAAEKNQPQTK